MNTQTTLTENDFADLLGIRQGCTDTMKWVQSRIARLGFGKTCTRCGGSGSYSWCQMYGTMCFKCGGHGKVCQKLTVKLYDEVKAKVDDGTNAEIQEELRQRSASKKAKDQVMQAWGEVGKVNPYNWRKSAESDKNPLHRKASEFNKIMHDAYDVVSKMDTEIFNTNLTAFRSRVATVEQQQEAKAKLPGMQRDLMKEAEKALATIAEVSKQVEEWHKTLTAEELEELSK